MSRRRKMYGGKKKMQAAGAKRPPETKADPKKAPSKYSKTTQQKYEEKRQRAGLINPLIDNSVFVKGAKALMNKDKKRAGGSSFIEESKEVKFGGLKYRDAGEKNKNIPVAKKVTLSDRPNVSRPGGGKQNSSAGMRIIDRDFGKKGKSFNDAFAEARKKQGAGGTFIWNGKKYSTDRADDKKKPAAAPSKVAKKSATKVKTGAKKPGLQKSTPIATTAEKSKKAKREDRRMDRKSNRMNRRTKRKETTRADKLRARADKADARMENRRARKNARKPQAPKGDLSKLNKDLEKLNQMRGGGLKQPRPDQKGLKKLPTPVRNKMGYARYGGGKKKAMFGMIGKVKGAIDGAKGGGGLMGAAKGALGGGLLGRAVGAVKGAAGGGGLKGAMQGFKQGAFGGGGGGAQAQPAADPNAQQAAARYGGRKSKMKNRRKSRRR